MPFQNPGKKLIDPKNITLHYITPSNNTFDIGSSNTKRVFGKRYPGNFLKISNPV